MANTITFRTILGASPEVQKLQDNIRQVLPSLVGPTGAAGPNGNPGILSTSQFSDIHSSAYTVKATDYYLHLDSTNNTIRVQLPPAKNAKQVLQIKDATGAASTHNITIAAYGQDQIDGASTLVFNMAYQAVTLTSNGSNRWMVN